MIRAVVAYAAVAAFLFIAAVALQGSSPWLWGGWFAFGYPGPTLAIIIVFFVVLAIIRAAFRGRQ